MINTLKFRIMKFLLSKLLPIIFIGMSLQAQTNSKVNLSFEDKVQSWLTENNVPAVGIGIIENGEITKVSFFPSYERDDKEPEVLKKDDPRAQDVFDYMVEITESEGLNAKFAWEGDEVVITE